MHLLTPILSLNSLFLPRNEHALPVDLEAGYWNLTLSGGSSTTGYVWHDVFSVYSGKPDTTVHCTYTRGPTTSASGDLLCDEMVLNTVTSNQTSFRYEWNGAAGLQDFTVRQTVEITVNGVKTPVNVTGKGSVELVCGLGFNRLACEGTGRVNATVVPL